MRGRVQLVEVNADERIFGGKAKGFALHDELVRSTVGELVRHEVMSVRAAG